MPQLVVWLQCKSHHASFPHVVGFKYETVVILVFCRVLCEFRSASKIKSLIQKCVEVPPCPRRLKLTALHNQYFLSDK